MSPVVYKSYLSSAKMKVLRPEMQEINEKYKGKENAMKRQQETMAIQRKAGVNPLSGCIPALIQMPVFFALFRFFPANIDIRQHGFLWADDLSAYDEVLQLPFKIPFYERVFKVPENLNSANESHNFSKKKYFLKKSHFPPEITPDQ